MAGNGPDTVPVVRNRAAHTIPTRAVLLSALETRRAP
jgi:hypothetical protein